MEDECLTMVIFVKALFLMLYLSLILFPYNWIQIFINLFKEINYTFNFIWQNQENKFCIFKGNIVKVSLENLEKSVWVILVILYIFKVIVANVATLYIKLLTNVL